MTSLPPSQVRLHHLGFSCGNTQTHSMFSPLHQLLSWFSVVLFSPTRERRIPTKWSRSWWYWYWYLLICHRCADPSAVRAEKTLGCSHFNHRCDKTLAAAWAQMTHSAGMTGKDSEDRVLEDMWVRGCWRWNRAASHLFWGLHHHKQSARCRAGSWSNSSDWCDYGPRGPGAARVQASDTERETDKH